MAQDRVDIIAHVLKITSVIIFSLVSWVCQSKMGHIGPLQQTFGIYAFGSAMLLPWMVARKSYLKQIKSYMTYVWRAVFTAVAMGAWLHSLRTLPLPQASAIAYLTPIVVSILAFLFLKEKCSIRWLIAMPIAAIGIWYLFPKEGIELSNQGVLYALLSVFSWAFYELVAKKQSVTDHYIAQSFVSFAFTALILAPFAFANWVALSRNDVLWFMVIGFLGNISIIVLFIAYQRAPLSNMTMHGYLKVVIALAFVTLISGTRPSLDMLIGCLFITLSNVSVVFPYEKFYWWRKNDAA